MIRVVGVRFRNNGRIYYFDPGELEIVPGDGVIVETARGAEFGDVPGPIAEVEEEQVVQPLKPVLRVATAEDRAMREESAAREAAAFAVCQEKIAKHGLDMKLVDVEYTFNGGKVIFYFTADERVDFRELVKDLAAHFHTRIELRQIGVRDEARMIGGLGSCGRPVCCKTFLDDFRPVSIRMAKDQNLSLSPTKISGLCGRLMCCLQYEQAAYEEMKKLMPKVGKEIQTPDGNGVAVENNAVTEKSRVKLTMPDGSFEMRWYHYSELAKVGDPPPQRREAPPAQDEGLAVSAAYVAPEGTETAAKRPRRRRRSGAKQQEPGMKQQAQAEAAAPQDEAAPKKPRRRHKKSAQPEAEAAAPTAQPDGGEHAAQDEAAPKKPRRRRRGGAGRSRPKPQAEPEA